MKNIFTTILFLIALTSVSQIDSVPLRYDTVITNQAYKSYYSKTYEGPVLVIYSLFHGGGECDRKKFHFKNDIQGLPAATDKDYAGSGWDKGHLCPAQDFAYDCLLEELTFEYYNCVPQAIEVNRAGWKHQETLIRNLSKNDSLIIICYNEFGVNKIGNVSIPTRCYKFVFDKIIKQFVFAFYYTNNSSADYVDLLDKLKDYESVLKFIK